MSAKTWKIRLPTGKVIEIRLPSTRRVLQWITGGAALASIVDFIVKLLRGR